jgi:carboxyl-terminal processing protease
MHRVVRPLAVFGIASGVSAAAAVQAVVTHPDEDLADYGASAFFPGYDLGRLELLEPTLYHVEESYAEPARVDWEQMFVAGLQAVERRVPVCLFHREPGGDVLSVEVGAYRTVLQVPPVGSRKELQRELRRVAALLGEHLGPDDVPDVADGIDDPLAEVEYALVNGILQTLDPHSVLLPPPDAHEMDVENHGEFGGLGITIVDRRGEGGMTIEATLPDTPAAQAGLQAEDRIVRIDGESTVNMTLDEAVKRLRGPVGAPVDVDVERPSLAEPLRVTVVRQLIGLNRVEGQLLEGGIGYVTIKSFHEHVERDLHDVLSRLHREAAASGDLRGLVLDLRGNPGGFLNQAVRVSDTFLTEGDIVSTIDGSGRRTDLERARRSAEPDYPVAVLIDASSASASEIVAGALRNNDRAVIVGERSFGKGSVQNLHTFYDDSKLKLTISKYLTPGDRSIQAVGIPADVELLPAVVEAAEEADGEPVVRLFHRERVRREADLDGSLEQISFHTERPAYQVRYLSAPGQRRAPRPADDAQVRMARDILLAANGQWRRTDVLQAAGRVVQQLGRQGNGEVEAAFEALGIDWSDGPAGSREVLPVSVQVVLGDEGHLPAGEEATVRVEVTNVSDEPLYRLAAVARDHGVLDGAEFFFGRLEPGETRTYERTVEVADGYGSEVAPLVLELRDAGEGALGEVTSSLRIEGHELPRLAWRWSVRDDDGDGIAEVGDTLRVHLELQNVGPGLTRMTTARIRTDDRKELDIVEGTLMAGAVEEGCEASDCPRRLAAGETFEGDFVVTVRDGARGALGIDLQLREEVAYDHASIMRAGFYEYYGLDDALQITVGEALPSADWRRPPTIEISRAPQLSHPGRRAALSGMVSDDDGLAHVMVFAGGDKVFFDGAGGGSLASVPFTADIDLSPGENVLTVLATDTAGYSATRSVVTWVDETAVARADGPR